MEPLVSIIIPVYNGSNYMKEAIDSAINQTYKNCEIIVINDGSTDNGETAKIAKSYGDKIVYYEKENGGVSTALNFGIKYMNGDYFSWLSHDDKYYPNKISTQIEYLIKHGLLNKNVILYSNFDIIDEKGKHLFRTKYERYHPNEKMEYAILRGLLCGVTMLIPKEAFTTVGYFDENYRCIQDYLLFFNFLKKYRYVFDSKTLSATRIHSKQVTYTNINIEKENNYLWTYMQKELPNDKKILLNGSIYNFYEEMYKFLIYNNSYKDAQDFSKKEMNNILENSSINIKKYITNVNKYNLLSNVKDYYYNNKVTDNNFKLLIENVGLYNFIDNILKYIELNSKDKIAYNIINKQLIAKKKKKPIMQRSGFERLTYSIKLNGVKKTIEKIIKHN